MSEIGVNPETGERYEGWADPTTQMPAGYKVPPEPPMITRDHNPQPVSKHPGLAAPYSGEGMKPGMSHVLDTLRQEGLAEDVYFPQNGDGPGRPELPLDQTKANPKHALGLTKVPLHFTPMSAVVMMALVFEAGAQDYGILNWRDTDVVRSVYLDALNRHYMALMDGQDLDEKSGLPHEAHIMACAAILIDARELGRLIDDRPTPGNVAAILKRYTKTAPASRGYPHDGAR